MSQLRKTLVNQRRERHKRLVTCFVPDCEDEGGVYQKVQALTCHVPAMLDPRIPNPDEKVEDQVAALVGLDESRILLETDASHFNRRV